MALQETRCGYGGFRPSWLQKCNNLTIFTVFVCAFLTISHSQNGYYSAVVTDIERRYGLSSATTGFIKNIDNIGVTVMTIFSSYFLNNFNKPRVLTVIAIITAVGIALFSLPHFLCEPIEVEEEIFLNISSRNQKYGFELCTAESVAKPEDNVNGITSTSRSRSTGTLAVFIFSELLQGVAKSPQIVMILTYIENISSKMSPRYFGFMAGTRALSPLVGFGLGAWASNIYVDLSEPGMSRNDPRWVGAWWVGYLLLALLTVIWGPALACFPQNMASQALTQDSTQLDGNTEVEDTSVETEAQSNNFVTLLKALPSALCRLAKNPVYILVLCGSAVNIFLLGFIVFLPKYLHSHFGVPPTKASIYTGGITAVTMMLGPMIAGMVVTRVAVTARGALTFMICIQLTGALAFTALSFVSCDQPTWADHTKPSIGASLRPLSPCNRNCSCTSAAFNPVCGADGLTYYSPCYAGCRRQQLNQTQPVFRDCACVTVAPQSALLGACPAPCRMLPLFVVMLFLALFCTSTLTVILLAIVFNCVAETDKGISIALANTLSNALAFPAPILFGAVIDSTCLVHQEANGRQGACLYYDSAALRRRQLVLCAGIKLTGVVCYAMALGNIILKKTEVPNKDMRERNVKQQLGEELTEILPDSDRTHLNTSLTDVNYIL